MASYPMPMDGALEPVADRSLRPLADSLGQVTRAERRGLLIANAVLALVVYGGMMPTEINALGISSNKVNGQAFLYLIIGVVIYFLTAFAIYAWSDFRVWKIDMQDHRRQRARRLVEADILDFAEPPDKKVMFALLQDKELKIWNDYAPLSVRASFDVFAPAVITILNLIRVLTIGPPG